LKNEIKNEIKNEPKMATVNNPNDISRQPESTAPNVAWELDSLDTAVSRPQAPMCNEPKNSTLKTYLYIERLSSHQNNERANESRVYETNLYASTY
jgi:hypothetical protein